MCSERRRLNVQHPPLILEAGQHAAQLLRHRGIRNGAERGDSSDDRSNGRSDGSASGGGDGGGCRGGHSQRDGREWRYRRHWQG